MQAHDEQRAISIGSLMLNFPRETVTRQLALSVAHDRGFHSQVRMRAHSVAGPPLDRDGISLVMNGLRHNDWDQHYEARNLVEIHADPALFLGRLLRDRSIPLGRREELAGDVTKTIPDATSRRLFIQACVSDPGIAEEIRLTLPTHQRALR